MFANQVAIARQQMPVPYRVAALALLWAYRESNVPLSYQTASDWYSVGGRWWRRVWTVCGFLKQGDKFYGPKSMAWGQPLSLADATALWADMEDLARASDEWQAAQGQDVPPPTVNVGELMSRSATWADKLTTLYDPVWEAESRAATPKKLVAILKEAAKKLDEWYKRRFPGRPPLPPPMPTGDGGVLLLLGAVALVVLGRRTTTRTRRRR